MNIFKLELASLMMAALLLLAQPPCLAQTETAETQPVAQSPQPPPIAKESPLSPVGESAQMFGVHAAFGVPHPMGFGLDFMTETKLFEVNLSFGFFGATTGGTTVSMTNSEAGLLYHPFASAFFVGALLGQQNLKAKNNSTINGIGNVTVEANIRTNYITPELGWHWQWSSGLNLGFEVGAQIPTSTQADLSTNAAILGVDTTSSTYTNFEKDVKDTGDKIGKLTLPYVTLLRVGWMF